MNDNLVDIDEGMKALMPKYDANNGTLVQICSDRLPKDWNKEGQKLNQKFLNNLQGKIEDNWTPEQINNFSQYQQFYFENDREPLFKKEHKVISQLKKHFEYAKMELQCYNNGILNKHKYLDYFEKWNSKKWKKIFRRAKLGFTNPLNQYPFLPPVYKWSMANVLLYGQGGALNRECGEGDRDAYGQGSDGRVGNNEGMQCIFQDNTPAGLNYNNIAVNIKNSTSNGSSDIGFYENNSRKAYTDLGGAGTSYDFTWIPVTEWCTEDDKLGCAACRKYNDLVCYAVSGDPYYAASGCNVGGDLPAGWSCGGSMDAYRRWRFKANYQ